MMVQGDPSGDPLAVTSRFSAVLEHCEVKIVVVIKVVFFIVFVVVDVLFVCNVSN